MANELVKEIEEALDCIESHTYQDNGELVTSEMGSVARQFLVATLQRAREALTWIPVSERPPDYQVPVLVQYKGRKFAAYQSHNLRGDFGWFEGITREPLDNAPDAWMSLPDDYTPEEK